MNAAPYCAAPTTAATAGVDAGMRIVLGRRAEDRAGGRDGGAELGEHRSLEPDRRQGRERHAGPVEWLPANRGSGSPRTPASMAKKPAGLRLRRVDRVGRRPTDRGDEQRRQVGAAEGRHGRRLQDGDGDLPIDGARGRHPQDGRAVHARDPVAAVLVHARAVGLPGRTRSRGRPVRWWPPRSTRRSHRPRRCRGGYPRSTSSARPVQARPFVTPMPLLTVTAVPSASTRWSRPVAGRGPAPEAMAGSDIDPTQNRPAGSQRPSLRRFRRSAASRTTQSARCRTSSRGTPGGLRWPRAGAPACPWRASDAGRPVRGPPHQAGGGVEAMDGLPVDIHPVETGIRRTPRRTLAQLGTGGRTDVAARSTPGWLTRHRRSGRSGRAGTRRSRRRPPSARCRRRALREGTRPARARTSRGSRRPRAP